MRAAAILLLCAAAVTAAACGDGECEDADGDGYCSDPKPVCNGDTFVVFCTTPPADCNDADPAIHPYAVDTPDDGIDQDCNGADATELCDGITDGDLDGLRGCADPQCAEQCAATLADRCEQASSTIVKISAVSLPGTLPTGLDTMHPSCFAGLWSEQVFHITPGKAGEVGSLHLSVIANVVGFSLRKACADEATEVACAPPSDAPDFTTVVKGGELLDLIVDGDAANYAGPVSFVVSAHFVPAVCGDGIRVLPEECDDGGLADGDGCSAQCAVETDFYCAAAIPLSTGYLSVDAAPDAPSAFTGSCTGKDLAERVFVFTPPADGQVAVGVQAPYRMGIYARTTCADAATEIGCEPARDDGVTTLTTQAKAGEPIFFFVDGGDDAFKLTTVFFPE